MNDNQYCSECGSRLPTGVRFCELCGTAVDTSVGAQPKPERRTTQGTPDTTTASGRGKVPRSISLGVWGKVCLAVLIVAGVGVAIYLNINDLEKKNIENVAQQESGAGYDGNTGYDGKSDEDESRRQSPQAPQGSSDDYDGMSDEDKVREAIRVLILAFIDRDSETVCGQLEDEFKQELVAEAQQDAEEEDDEELWVNSCEELMDNLVMPRLDLIPETSLPEPENVKDLEIEVTIRGDTAKAKEESFDPENPEPEEYELEKEDGEWKFLASP